MLHRSFKPAKCKTALKLAASRLKLMKNKRDVQVKQLKKELAKLLESDQVQTARIRVEHVVREQKTIAAYDLLEIYCELIAARLPMIESQKTCPIDLKEAVSSVIFASPRCDDIPELKDVRKQLTAKYGKEFASAATELRPNSGVGRLLVEKLSAAPPDGPTKLKILIAIGEEYNVTWDPNKFSESDPRASEQLLNGPSTFGNASETLGDLPTVPSVQPNYSDNRSNNVRASYKSNERSDFPENLHDLSSRSSPRAKKDDSSYKMERPSEPELRPTDSAGRTELRHTYSHKSNERHDSLEHFHEPNVRSSPRAQNDNSVHEMERPSAFQPELRPAGSSAGRTESRHTYSGQEQQFSPSGQSWNMEFKDATAAAQAAAESAERASMAARAAAELSSRANSNWHYSTQLQRDEESQGYATSTMQNEQRATAPVNSAFHEGDPSMNFAKTNSDLQHHVAGNIENVHKEGLKSFGNTSRSASLKTTAASVSENRLGNSGQVAEKYSQNNPTEPEHTDVLDEVSFKNQSSGSEVEFVSKLKGDGNTKWIDSNERKAFQKQCSHVSSPSQSSALSDELDAALNIDSQSIGDNANDNPFATNDDGFVQRNSTEANYHEHAAALFDDSGSDDDAFETDTKNMNKDHDFGSEFFSQNINSPAHVFANANVWSDVQNENDSREKSTSISHFYAESHSHPIFSESVTSSRVPSKSDDMFSASFDDSDGTSSESGDELVNAKLGRSQGVPAESKEDANNLKPSNLDKSTELDSSWSRLDMSRDPHEHSVSPRASEKSSLQLSAAQEDAKPSKESIPDSGTELNYGLLTGGLRNKGNRHLPYKMVSTANSSSSKKTAERIFSTVEDSTTSLKALSSPTAASQDQYNIKVKAEAEKRTSSRAYVGDGYFDEELAQSNLRSNKSTLFKETETIEDKKSRPQVKDYDSDESDPEPVSLTPKQVSMRKAPVNNSFSRRTKAPSNTWKSSYSKTPGSSESSSSAPGNVKETSGSSSSLYSNEIKREPQSQRQRSGALESSEESRLPKQPAYKPDSPAKRSSFVESLKPSAQPPLKPSVEEQPSLSSKTSSLESPSMQKRAAHVHPKLPDYDTLAARLQSLRQNRQ